MCNEHECENNIKYTHINAIETFLKKCKVDRLADCTQNFGF